MASLDPVINTLERAIADIGKHAFPATFTILADKIVGHLDKTPGAQPQHFDDPIKKLEFCDFSHYEVRR